MTEVERYQQLREKDVAERAWEQQMEVVESTTSGRGGAD